MSKPNYSRNLEALRQVISYRKFQLATHKARAVLEIPAEGKKFKRANSIKDNEYSQWLIKNPDKADILERIATKFVAKYFGGVDFGYVYADAIFHYILTNEMVINDALIGGILVPPDMKGEDLEKLSRGRPAIFINPYATPADVKRFVDETGGLIKIFNSTRIRKTKVAKRKLIAMGRIGRANLFVLRGRNPEKIALRERTYLKRKNRFILANGELNEGMINSWRDIGYDKEQKANTTRSRLRQAKKERED